jgi:hypothetical protein
VVVVRSRGRGQRRSPQIRSAVAWGCETATARDAPGISSVRSPARPYLWSNAVVKVGL